MKYLIYGDGIHDDYPGIQERIDNGGCELVLSPPAKCYLISRTLVLPPHFRLVLPRFAEIRLVDGADCLMLRNRWRELPWSAENSVYEGRDRIWRFAEMISPAPEDLCENVEVTGGIWNFNNKKQTPNPLATQIFDDRFYTGFGMQFFNVRNLKLSDMTLKDPVTFAVTIDLATDFTIENITFDFNYGNPIALNMDGIHMDGNCHRGVIRNLKGACYDDLVALNAYEGYAGPVTDIEIDGLFAEDCHSAVRLLALREKMERIHISNIYGTYYQYCVGISKFYRAEVTDGFDMVTIDNVYASKAIRYTDRYPQKPTDRVYPLIWVQDGVILKNLTLRSIHRRENNVPIETISIGKCARPVEQIIIEDVTVVNNTGTPTPVILNRADIGTLRLSDIRSEEEILKNEGTVGKLIATGIPSL